MRPHLFLKSSDVFKLGQPRFKEHFHRSRRPIPILINNQLRFLIDRIRIVVAFAVKHDYDIGGLFDCTPHSAS
jgi:hypothetical protein